MSEPVAFYQCTDGVTYVPSDATTSPWDDGLQHGSPPTALLVSVLVRRHPQAHMRVSRIAVDFMGPIPRKPATVRTRILRPGRRIELSEATLECEGRDVVVVRVWRVGIHAGGSVPETATEKRQLPAPKTEAGTFGPGAWGYSKAFEWRFVRGGKLGSNGPAEVWTKPRIPLIAGVEAQPFDGALLIVDSMNGVSAELSFQEWLFVPPSLSIVLLRYPAGDWTFLASRTMLASDGAGATTGELADELGTFGFANQALYVEPRSTASRSA